ncbi:MAG: hypothetical protein ABIH23_25720 [bacterium]
MTDLETRLEKLERQNKRLLRAAVSVILLGMVGLVFMGVAPSELRDLEASSLAIKDSNGKERISLGCSPTEGCPIIDLLNEEGKKQLRIIADKKGSGILFIDENGEYRINLSYLSETGPHLFLCDQNYESSVTLDFAEEGPMLTFRDKYKKLRAYLGIEDGAPKFAILDEHGEIERVAYPVK